MTQSHPPVLLSPSEAGRELYSVRPQAGPLAWLVFVAALAGGFLLGWAAPDIGVWGGVAGLIGAFVLVGSLFLTGHLDKHRVCENALVLGLSPWPRGQPYVIPWSTVPVDSLTLHAPANRPGQGSAGEMGARGTRMAPYSRKAVSVAGLHPDLAHPRRRERTGFAQQLLATVSPEDLAARPPLTRWAMGVRDPEPLLRAIETAMARHDPAAEGSADKALANPVAGRIA